MDVLHRLYWMAGLYRIAVSLYHWILLELDRISWVQLDNSGWMRTHGYCKDRTDGMDGTYGNDGNDGLDGALVGLVWDG